VLSQAPERSLELKGPSVKVGLDSSGQPTQALIKWAEKQGAPVASLTTASDGKQDCFYWHTRVAGAALVDVINEILEQALASLPIPKLMQYQLADGQTNVSFVRPAHRLTLLHGADVIAASILGLSSGRITEGHRFQSPGEIRIAHAKDYESTLEREGRVIAAFDRRRDRIDGLLRSEAARQGASLGDEAQVAPLLDEVCALVEWPAVYVGRFDSDFLKVPQECLILTMRTNQKYFPLFDSEGRLLSRFLIVSNMQVADPIAIIDGNQRVVRPRLADARFFFEQDRKTPLADRVPQLASVVYHARLGTQAERTERLRSLARTLAHRLEVSAADVDRAAMLAKADLLTGMVGEFPELQGVMGRYYAIHDGELPAVAQAIVEHYQPRFAGDHLPASPCGTIIALADKLETLAGLFGIGQLPTGDKDPFALRRHALGVIRMLVEKQLAITLPELIDAAFAVFGDRVQPAHAALESFIYERLVSYLRERGYTAIEVACVVEQRPQELSQVPARLAAVRAFSAMPQAQALAAANKRIGNILRKAQVEYGTPLESSLLIDAAEQELAQLVEQLAPQVASRLQGHDFTGALSLMAQTRESVDRFFDQVMVMADDPALRNNRLTLLSQLHALMNRVADISRLSVA
jgi:glycyl-tRNA synthetase beta chain